MPRIPPMAVQITDEKESVLPPHTSGTKPPAVDPTKNPNQINFFSMSHFIISLERPCLSSALILATMWVYEYI